MMRFFARLVGGVATEIWNDGGLGISPADVHVPELAAQFIPCQSDTLPGAIYDGTTWTNPEIDIPPVPQLIPVVITDVQGDEDGFDNTHNEYTVKLGREMIITGPLPVPDQKFRVPCTMRDTGRTIAAVADVVGGQMTITVTLPELGCWETTAEMLNAAMAQPTFSLNEPIRFVVI
ncbi:hypothetical protein [Aeromonas veronii]|uniref:hypothetical protein n=1 Tax=Aeromonas veronii TaxID=654 RepID=UPI002443DFDF|nr:hypothetical protein [Aeromonas veronii]